MLRLLPILEADTNHHHQEPLPLLLVARVHPAHRARVRRRWDGKNKTCSINPPK